MMIILRAAAAIGASAILCAPASAALWQVQGTGTVSQSPAVGNEIRLEGVPFDREAIFFTLTIDDSVTPFDNMPPGGIGQSRTYPAAVVGFSVTIGSANIVRKAGAPGSLFLLNDAGVAPTVRLDQLSYSESVRSVPGSITSWFETDAALPPGAFLTGFNFGRSVTTTAPAVPGLLTSADLPALDSIWQPHPSEMFLTLDVRAGTPTNPAEFSRLPRARFATSGLQFTVRRLQDTPAVPEPASWALLIAGFGLVGTTLRRRRSAAA